MKKSKYANPGDRPQHKKAKNLDRDVIFTRVSSDSDAMLNTLAGKRNQSAFMNKLNKPMQLN